MSLGPRSDVFDAEMAALAIAAKRVESLVTPTTPTVLFFADNQAAVQQIVNLKPHAAQAHSILFRKSIDCILTQFPHLSIEIYWIPGHAGIAGNERADVLANEAGDLPPTQFFNRTITWARARAKSRAVSTWRKQWCSARHSDAVLRHIPHVPTWKLHPFHDAFDGTRATHSRLIQALVGHGFFGEYYLRFVPSEDPACPCDHNTLHISKKRSAKPNLTQLKGKNERPLAEYGMNSTLPHEEAPFVPRWGENRLF
jgi:hypothetical protein